MDTKPKLRRNRVFTRWALCLSVGCLIPLMEGIEVGECVGLE